MYYLKVAKEEKEARSHLLLLFSQDNCDKGKQSVLGRYPLGKQKGKYC